jgi:GNAT superfamily N-acetyltransferase
MLNIHCLPAGEIPEFIAQQCRRLCHDDSEMQQLFGRMIDGALADHERLWPVAYCWVRTRHSIGVIGWASATDWHVGNEVRRQVQLFVATTARRRGVGTALCVCLGSSVSKDNEPVAVFSREAMSIAKRLGWKANQYKSTDDGWIGVASFDGRRGREGSDSAGVHDAAPTVRSVPLARREKGQDA